MWCIGFVSAAKQENILHKAQKKFEGSGFLTYSMSEIGCDGEAGPREVPTVLLPAWLIVCQLPVGAAAHQPSPRSGSQGHPAGQGEVSASARGCGRHVSVSG